MREISIKIETVEVKANARRLGEVRETSRKGKRKFVWRKKIRWTFEPIQDLVIHYSPEVIKHFEELYG